MRQALALLVILCSGSAQAALVNSQFETGDLTGWSSLGAVDVFSGDAGVAVIQGAYSGRLSNDAGSVSDTALESFLGLSAGALDTFSAGLSSGGDVAEGSAMSFSYNANVGDKIYFDLVFLTDENLNNPLYNDFAFASIDGVLLLADTYSAGTSPVVDNTSEYWTYSATGVLSFEYTLGSSGTIDIGVGVVDAADPGVSTVLLVDNFSVTSVPIPAAGWLFFSGLGLLGWRRGRKAA